MYMWEMMLRPFSSHSVSAVSSPSESYGSSYVALVPTDHALIITLEDADIIVLESIWIELAKPHSEEETLDLLSIMLSQNSKSSLISRIGDIPRIGYHRSFRKPKQKLKKKKKWSEKSLTNYDPATFDSTEHLSSPTKEKIDRRKRKMKKSMIEEKIKIRVILSFAH